MIQIITHRGLDPSRPDYYAESSAEAFVDQLKRGYGLEFDPQATKDKELVILHDSNLKRISKGRIDKAAGDLTLAEIEAEVFDGCHLISFNNLLEYIKKVGDDRISAIHLKCKNQSEWILDKVADTLKGLEDKFIIFDLTAVAATYFKNRNSNLHLAASMSHPFDVQRYNSCVGGTLFSAADVIQRRDLFDWAWLDEWDRTDANGKEKSLYNRQVFSDLRKHDFKIALVSPELHGTSPGLLGGEAHQDAASKTTLLKRMNEIIKLKPDLVCTDYPDRYQEILC